MCVNYILDEKIAYVKAGYGIFLNLYNLVNYGDMSIQYMAVKVYIIGENTQQSKIN